MGIFKKFKNIVAEKRANAKENKESRREFKLAKIDRRQEGKNYRTDSRVSGRTDKVKARQEGKTERNDRTQDANEVAYENGITPARGTADNIISTVGDVVSSVFGKNNASADVTEYAYDYNQDYSPAGGSKNMIFFLIGAVILFIDPFGFFKRKKA